MSAALLRVTVMMRAVGMRVVRVAVRMCAVSCLSDLLEVNVHVTRACRADGAQGVCAAGGGCCALLRPALEPGQPA